ncbi:unnamed protein product [Clavelina lepadiformis]|uniref:Uncharacterized protein n=1 Tax=Clavelina lepadiformis TaxID=159417 RepID=A0ABP0FIA4_CLALP
MTDSELSLSEEEYKAIALFIIVVLVVLFFIVKSVRMNSNASSSGSKTDQKPTADVITTTQPKESHCLTIPISKDGKGASKDGEQIKNKFATLQMESATHQSDILAEKNKMRHLEVQLETERDLSND